MRSSRLHWAPTDATRKDITFLFFSFVRFFGASRLPPFFLLTVFFSSLVCLIRSRRRAGGDRLLRLPFPFYRFPPGSPLSLLVAASLHRFRWVFFFFSYFLVRRGGAYISFQAAPEDKNWHALTKAQI